MDLLSQYNGNNNGDLCAALTVLKDRGWKSNSTLTKARKELLGAAFLIQTRQGGRHKPTLFALTFFAIDECLDKSGRFSKHEAKPANRPGDDWLQSEVKIDLTEARQRKKRKDDENHIAELQKHLDENPSGKYQASYNKGIKVLEQRLEN